MRRIAAFLFAASAVFLGPPGAGAGGGGAYPNAPLRSSRPIRLAAHDS